MTRQRFVMSTLTVGFVVFSAVAFAQETAMFGNTPSRNMVSNETGVVAKWDVSTGTNVLWTQPVGSQAYGGPVVANGRVEVLSSSCIS